MANHQLCPSRARSRKIRCVSCDKVGMGIEWNVGQTTDERRVGMGDSSSSITQIDNFLPTDLPLLDGKDQSPSCVSIKGTTASDSPRA